MILFWRFLRSVVLQWANLVSGGIIGGAFFLAAGAGRTIPHWLYGAAGSVAFLYAAFQAWRVEAARADEAVKSLGGLTDERPTARLMVRTHEADVLLDITNGSEVQAKFTVESTTSIRVGGYTRHEVAWDEGEQGPRVIPAGQTRTIRAARLRMPRKGIYQWALVCPRSYEAGRVFRVFERYSEERHIRDAGSLWELTTEVIAEPQLREGISRRTFRISGTTISDVEGGVTFNLSSEAATKDLS
jgi:hypothetical protein